MHDRLPHAGARRGRVAILVAAAVALSAAACSTPPPTVNVDAAAPVGTGPANGITVDGRGEVEGTPDTLTLTFGVSVTRETVDAAVADNAAAATAVLGALVERGVDQSDVQTRDYSIQPSFDYREGRPVPTGYQVSNRVTVSLHDLTAAGATIDVVTAAGGDATQVQGVAFSLEDDTETVASARQRAFEDARARAEQFAALAGRPLGAVESVAEVGRSTSPVAQAEYAAASDGASTPISPGEVTTSVAVTVRYSLG